MSRRLSAPTSAPIKECARWMGLDYQWLYGLVRGGQIPAENRGTPDRAKWWARPADIEAYLDGLRESA